MDGKTQRPKSNWAQIISAVVGVLGFGAVIIQVNMIRNNFSEAAARQVYMSYSESELRHPEFVDPDLIALRADRLQFVRYKNFVAHMLFAYDEMLSVYDHEEWHRSFAHEIKHHMDYVCFEMTPDDDATYFATMRNMLLDLRKACPAKPTMR
jgi:hypothetical protein